MRVRPRRAVWLLSLCWASTAVALEPLQCPAGTTLKRVENKQRGVNEICLNGGGKRHGPERSLRADGTLISEGMNDAATGRSVGKLYDEKGELTAEITLQDGKFAAWHLTRLGLENMLAPLNADFEKEGHPARVRVLDEQTVGLDYHFTDADPIAGADKLGRFRKYVRSDCGRMFSKLEQLQTVKVRVLNDRDATPSMETDLRRSDCGPQDPE